MWKLKVAVGVLIPSGLLAATMVKTKAASTPSFEPATVVSSVDPVYPETSTSCGTVVLSVSIGPAGNIQKINVTQSAGAFDSSALDAIKEWQFKPAMLNDNPVSSDVPVAFSFAWPAVCGVGGGRRTNPKK
jgi:TonB family protein